MFPEPSDTLLRWASFLGGLGTAVAAAFALVAVPVAAWQIAEARRSMAAGRLIEIFKTMPVIITELDHTIDNRSAAVADQQYLSRIEINLTLLRHCAILLDEAVKRDRLGFGWEISFLTRRVEQLVGSIQRKLEDFYWTSRVNEQDYPDGIPEGMQDEGALCWVESAMSESILPELRVILARLKAMSGAAL